VVRSSDWENMFDTRALMTCALQCADLKGLKQLIENDLTTSNAHSALDKVHTQAFISGIVRVLQLTFERVPRTLKIAAIELAL